MTTGAITVKGVDGISVRTTALQVLKERLTGKSEVDIQLLMGPFIRENHLLLSILAGLLTPAAGKV